MAKCSSFTVSREELRRMCLDLSLDFIIESCKVLDEELNKVKTECEKETDLKPISNSENSECNEELTDQKCIDIKEEPVDIKTESDYLYSCENDNEVFPKEEGYNLGEYVKIIFNSLKNPSTKIIFKKKLHELILEMYDLENCQNG